MTMWAEEGNNLFQKKNLEKVSLQMLIYKGGRYGFFRFIFKILIFASLPG